MQTVLWIWCIEWMNNNKPNEWMAKKLCVEPNCRLQIYSMGKRENIWILKCYYSGHKTGNNSIISNEWGGIESESKNMHGARAKERCRDSQTENTQFAYEIWFLAYKQLCLLKIGKMQIGFCCCCCCWRWIEKLIKHANQF